MLEAFKAYVASHLASAEGEVRADVEAAFAKVIAFVTGAEARIAAEVEHLTGLGFTVTPPAPAAQPPAAEQPAGQ